MLECNWKVFVDNYQDGGYHVNTVHPGLAGALDYAQYRTELLGNNTVQISPIKASDDPTVGMVRTGTHAYYWWIFPNLMVNLYQGVMDTNLVVPLGPDRCRVYFDFYFADVASEQAQRFNADSIAVAHQVQLEDWGVCEEVQRGLKSRTYNTGRFSVEARERRGYYFHQLLAKALALSNGERRCVSPTWRPLAPSRPHVGLTHRRSPRKAHNGPSLVANEYHLRHLAAGQGTRIRGPGLGASPGGS